MKESILKPLEILHPRIIDSCNMSELYKVNVPKKYRQGMKLSNLTIFFDNLATKSNSEKHDNYAFDFMII